EAFLATLPGGKVTPSQVDARDLRQVAGLMAGLQAVVMLLPSTFGATLAPLAVENGLHWVDASYTLPEYRSLDQAAAARGLAILPEFGLDPGLDLVLAAQAISELDEVEEFYSYGAGIPEPGADDNPLRYKISWTFDGVVRSYARPARLLQDGRVVELQPPQVFTTLHTVMIEGLGSLEAFPNGDAVRYVEQLGLPGVRQAGRYTLRWPGHSAFWHKLAALGFLAETPLATQGTTISPRRFLHDLLEPQLHYQPHERDIALVRVEVRGRKDGRPRRVVYQVLDRRDLATGLLAMQRTVGYTASIGAQMILRGDIPKRGLLSPLFDVPPGVFLGELQRRGITVHREEHVWVTGQLAQ
ncbi:MAG: saccharopine dehydrogenase NADP-binding domain-containing protein, partial [Chloroflexi bacterium]|nr:saccharopine dehydrogenase NADP-binding domain-containing protein [Chloroflexota bacterium]